MELRDLVAILSRRWKTLIAAVVAALVVAGGLYLLTPKQYESRTDVFVGIRTAETADELVNVNTYAQQRARVYSQTISTPAVLDKVTSALGMDQGSLDNKVSAEVPLDGVIITIRAHDGDPDIAQRISAETATQLSVTMRELEATDQNPLTSRVIRPATLPTSPVSPSLRLLLAGGLLGGALLGLLLALIQEARSATPSYLRGGRSRERAKEYPLPTADADAV